MFSTGQLVFAVAFIIVFVTVLIFVYRKDVVVHKKYYKGTYRILIAFLAFIAVLFAIKLLTKDNS
jgi:uncharacterized membrane protein YccC